MNATKMPLTKVAVLRMVTGGGTALLYVAPNMHDIHRTLATNYLDASLDAAPYDRIPDVLSYGSYRQYWDENAQAAAEALRSCPSLQRLK